MSKELIENALKALSFVTTPHGGTRAHVWDSEEAKFIFDVYKELEKQVQKNNKIVTTHPLMNMESDKRVAYANGFYGDLNK